MAVHGASSSHGGKRKRVTRETQYKRTKAAESARRKLSTSNGENATSTTSNSKGKGKAKEVEENPHPFRYKSFNDRLANVHINISNSLGRSGTGALSGLEGHGILPVAGSSSSRMQLDGKAFAGDGEDEDDSDDEDAPSELHARTSFGIALNSWKELNLSLPFTLILQQVQPLSHSLPMLLHYQEKIAKLLEQGLSATHRDSYLGYEPLLDLIPRLASDLGSAFLPCFPDLLTATLRITMISKLNTDGEEYTAAMLVERAFESAAATLRCVAPFVLREQKSSEGEANDWLQSTWQIVRPYLGWRGDRRISSSEVKQSNAASLEELEVTEDIVQEEEDHKPKHAKIPPHTRRFASEALAHLVRRAKGEQLVRVAAVMMQDLQGEFSNESKDARVFTSGIAGVWVEVAKSVDHRLHSAATEQLAALLLPSPEKPWDMQGSQARMVVGCDIITALVHHGQSPHLVSLFDWLAKIVRERLSVLRQKNGVQQLDESIKWLTTFIGTRKGKRVDDSIKPHLFDILVLVAGACKEEATGGDEEIGSSMLQLLALSLPIGRIQDLIGPGRKIVDSLASPQSDGSMSPAFVALASSLGQPDFEFAGYRQIVLPSVMTSSTHLLQGNTSANSKSGVLCLLATLQKQGQFDHLASTAPTSISTFWIKAVCAEVLTRVQAWAERLKSADYSPDESMLASLSLASLAHEKADDLIKLLCECVAALIKSDQRDDFDSTPLNSAAMLGATLDALSQLIAKSKKSVDQVAYRQLSAIKEVQNLPLVFAWHRQVVCAYAGLVLALRDQGCILPVASVKDLFGSLQSAVTSSDEPLRLAAARLLALADLQHQQDEKLHGLLAGIVEIEETALTVESVRERNVRMRALGRELVKLKQNTKEDLTMLDTYAGVVVAYLVSVFKLNFKPLWEEGKKALVDISVVYGQLVWETAFNELKTGHPIATLPSTWSNSDVQEEVTDLRENGDDSIDKQFIDPQLAQRRMLVADAYKSQASRAIYLSAIEGQRPGGRLDLINYQGLILKLFASITILAERNNSPLMQHFFDTIVSRKEEINDDDDGDSDEGESKAAPGTESALRLTMPQRRAQLCAYLETFAQFSNPKALYRSQEFHDYLYRLCSQGDNKIQSLALDVVLQWKDPAHITYQAILKKLTDQSQFREELTSLKLAPDGDTIQVTHRKRLLPLLIRLFFGIMVSKRGRASQGSGQTGRKNAILTALASLPCEELEALVDVMLEPFKDQTSDASKGSRFEFSLEPPSASSGQQLGFLSMLGDVIKHLGLQITPVWDRFVGVLLNLTYHASKRAEKGQGRATLLDRSIRQGGLRRLDDFFKQPTDAFDWSPYVGALFEHLVSPRLPLLRSESIQSPSALLDLIHTWSNSSTTVLYLVEYDKTLLEHVAACLQMPTVKASVVDRVLDVVDAVLAYVDAADKDAKLARSVEVDILRPHTSAVLAGITPLVQRCNRLSPIEAKAMKRDDLMRRLLRILSKLSAYVVTEEDAASVLDALSPLLRKNNAIIAEKSKVDLLIVFEQLLGLIPAMQDAQSSEFESQYQLFSGLFSRLRSRSARLALADAFAKLASVDAGLAQLTEWMSDLNSFDVKRMEEYDFDRRLKVFDLINEEGLGGKVITSREWLPLLHNFLFNLQDADELAIRSNAGTSIRRFIDVVKNEKGNAELAALFKNVVYPGFRRTLRSKSELVQREVVSLLGYAVTELGSSFDFLSEMTPLLVNGDEEASFFNNIFHIQLHRRIRALTRLGQEAANESFSSRVIAEIFLPLVDQFLNTDTHHGEANLIQAAVEALGKLSMHLRWGPYNVLLWKFLSIGKKTKDGDKEKEKEKSDKVCVRAAMSILDNFHFQMDETADIDVVDEDREGEGEGEGETQGVAQIETAEESRKVLDAVMNRLLPKLMDFLDMKDDLEDTVRLPIAVGVARVMLKLPHLQKRQQITRLLTTLANVFKSKAQDTRDLARVTLGRVAVSLGPDYFPAIVKELRRALVRGPQRAVLAYTLHNILVQCMSSEVTPLVKLEYGTADVVDVVMEDMFGLTAEDRDSIENRTTYKEVKSVKSPDTLEQVAKIVSTGQVAALLAPLRDLMHQTEAVKAVKSMDDYLRRVAAGLFVNEHVSNSDFLLLCHSLFTSNADFLQSSKKDARKKPSRVSAVLRKRSELEDGVVRDYYTRNAYKFVTFGLDLLINALRKGKFDYSDGECLAKLDPMVHAVGNCLYASQSAVLIAGLKALALLVKCPIPSVQSSLPLIVKQALQIVEKEGANAQSDVLMAALKLLTVVIRDLPASTLQDRQVTQLCRLININLEEDAEMQGVLFGLLRAIVGRKFVVAEVYDVMDKVASMMITNQSQSIRDVSRSTYLSFLLEYPQGKQRFTNQMRFLAKNISYVFESGRLSLFEMLRIIFIKVDESTLRDHLNLFFVSLVMCLGNDESSKCKEKAAKLIVQILDLSRREEREKLVDLVHLWGSGEKRDLMRIGMMIYGLFAEAESLKDVNTWKSKAISNARLVLATSAEDLHEREMLDDGEDGEEQPFDWQLPFHALQVVSKLYSSRVDEVDKDAELWDGVRELLLYPHAWVRSAACRMIGQRLARTEVQPPKRSEGAFLSLPHLLTMTRKSSLMLKSDHLDDALALQLVKNLVFIGKSFALVSVQEATNGKDDEDGGDEDGDDSEGEREEDSHDWSLENPLRWMFAKLSHQLRQCKLTSASMEKVNLLQPTSLLKWIAAMVHHLPVEKSRLFLTHIISPLYRLLEAEAHLARNNEGISQLQALASEVQDLIQQKLGTSAYSTTYASIKQKMAEKRKKRKNDALMMAIEQPERAMQRKATINRRKHDSRKRKTQAYATNKERIRPTKRAAR